MLLGPGVCTSPVLWQLLLQVGIGLLSCRFLNNDQLYSGQADRMWPTVSGLVAHAWHARCLLSSRLGSRMLLCGLLRPGRFCLQPSIFNPLDPTDEFIRHFGPLHLWKPFQTQRGSKTLPVCPNCKITGTFRKKLHAGMEGGRCPLRSRAPRNRANCAPVGMVLDSPSPTRAKGGGGRQATPTVSPFVCVSLVSVVD